MPWWNFGEVSNFFTICWCIAAIRTPSSTWSGISSFKYCSRNHDCSQTLWNFTRTSKRNYLEKFDLNRAKWDKTFSNNKYGFKIELWNIIEFYILISEIKTVYYYCKCCGIGWVKTVEINRIIWAVWAEKKMPLLKKM